MPRASRMNTRPAESGNTAENSCGVPDENFFITDVASDSGVVTWAERPTTATESAILDNSNGVNRGTAIGHGMSTA